MTAAPTESVVYVIGNADNRLVKIGWTTQRKLKRLGQIQTMSPSILTVLWTTPGGRPLEDALHSRFLAERRQGEWFDFGDRDPVAEVKRAVVTLDAASKPVAPADALWRAVDGYWSWLERAPVEQRRTAPVFASDLAYSNAEILQMLAADSEVASEEPLLPEAIGAFQLAHQRLRGIDYANSVGVASPRATIALISNMAWLAECAAGIVEDDSLIIYSPQLAADFVRHAAHALRQLGEALAQVGISMREAGHRGEAAPSIARTLGSIPEVLDFAAEDLVNASRELRDARYKGYVARSDDDMARALFDELFERNFEPAKRLGNASEITFYYQELTYALVKDGHDWALDAPLRNGRLSRMPLGFVDGAANHPAQIVNEALDVADSLLDLYDHSTRRRHHSASQPRNERGDVTWVSDDPKAIRTRLIDEILGKIIDISLPNDESPDYLELGETP